MTLARPGSQLCLMIRNTVFLYVVLMYVLCVYILLLFINLFFYIIYLIFQVLYKYCYIIIIIIS